VTYPHQFSLDSPDKFDQTIGSINDAEESPEKSALNHLKQLNNDKIISATVFNEGNI
jgi:hypothetical protein